MKKINPLHFKTWGKAGKAGKNKEKGEYFLALSVLFYIKKRFGQSFRRMMVSECGQKTLGTNIGRCSHLDDSLELENNEQHMCD